MSNASPAETPLLRVAVNDNRVVVGVAIDVDMRGETPTFLVQILAPGLLPVETVAVTDSETAARRAWLLLARALRQPRFVAIAGGGYRAIECMTGPIVGRPSIARRGRRSRLRRRHPSRRHIALAAARTVGCSA